MNFSEFLDYPDKIINKLINSPSVLQLVFGYEDVSVVDSDMIDGQLFPFDFVPDVVTENKVFICADCDIPRIENSTIKDVSIHIWVFMHNDLMKKPSFVNSKGNRRDILCNEIDKIMNGNIDFGIGRVELQSAKRFKITNNYSGRELIYRAVDFNYKKNSTL